MKKISFQENKNAIYRQLKLARVQKGLSQSQLAARMQLMGVNMDQQMISKIENNHRIVTDYELACFCMILEQDIAYLLEDFYKHHVE